MSADAEMTLGAVQAHGAPDGDAQVVGFGGTSDGVAVAPVVVLDKDSAP